MPGLLRGTGHLQTFIDTYSKVAFAKLYDRKTPITAADLLNDRGAVLRRARRDDVAQQHLPFVKRIAPGNDGADGHRVLTEPPIIISLPASIRLAMAISPSRQQLARSHFAQIHADRIIGAADIVVVKIARGLRRRRRPRRQP
jgi:hypothetical protein